MANAYFRQCWNLETTLFLYKMRGQLTWLAPMVVFALTTGYSIILHMGQDCKQLIDPKLLVVLPSTRQLLLIH